MNGADPHRKTTVRASGTLKWVLLPPFTAKFIAKEYLKTTRSQGNCNTTLQAIVDLLDRFEPADVSRTALALAVTIQAPSLYYIEK